MPRKFRPEILGMPNIPKPLHGLNPRTIMGPEKWGAARREVYSSTQFHCAACGVHKRCAKKHQWLEAHEIFDIDYKRGVATLTEIVPLCHFCHRFIHSGLLVHLVETREMSLAEASEILMHGCMTLLMGGGKMSCATAHSCDLFGVDRSGVGVHEGPKSVAHWGQWKMIWDGIEYRGKFPTMAAWERFYS